MKEIAELRSLLADKEWRIFSGKLYVIKDKYGNKVPFVPNEFQRKYYRERHTKNLILKARQLGFSTFIDISLLDDALFSSDSNFGIIAHNLDAAHSIFNEKIKFAYENLPDWLLREFPLATDRSGELKFSSNGCAVNVDTSFRSATLQALHISEYGKICAKYPEKAREIQTGALNAVAPTARVDIESTAEGSSGNFFDMCQRAIAMEEAGKALTDMDYKFHFYPWYVDPTYELEDDFPIYPQTLEYFRKLREDEYVCRKFPDVVFTEAKMRWYQKKAEEQGDDMAREYPSYPKEAFDLAIKGAYYERELGTARRQKRIANVPYDERLKVYTSWDLGGAGGGDETAIWWYQTMGREIRFIDYWEGSGYSLTEIASTVVNAKPYDYAEHFLPHDAEVHEYTTGTTRLETARKILRGRVSVTDRLALSDGIHSVREMFPNAYFDETNCQVGLSRLQGYRREYDEKNGIFKDKPKHDVNSNGADAFRYAAVNYKKQSAPKPDFGRRVFHDKITGTVRGGTEDLTRQFGMRPPGSARLF